jgi:hypothetical protein
MAAHWTGTGSANLHFYNDLMSYGLSCTCIWFHLLLELMLIYYFIIVILFIAVYTLIIICALLEWEELKAVKTTLNFYCAPATPQ